MFYTEKSIQSITTIESLPKREAAKESANNDLIGQNLKQVNETLKTVKETTETGKSLWSTAQEVFKTVSPWLGVAALFWGL